MEILAQEILKQDALTAAPALIGWELVTRTGAIETAGRIVEVEAYMGTLDPASHAFRGPSKRNAPMFEGGGYIYTYLSYGVHTCMNLVTGPGGGHGQAVLIRALEPIDGHEVMAARRGLTDPRLLCNGPGKLTQALGITLADSGTLLGGTISLRPPDQALDPALIKSTPRIGISSAKDLPWRFLIAGSTFISRK